MKWGKLSAVAVSVLLAGVLMVHAEEPAMNPPVEGGTPAKLGEKPDKAIEKPKKAVRIIKPYSDLASLTEEQRQQIADIHKKVVDEIKAIQLKEEQDVLALLTDEQKTELAKLKEEEGAKKKMPKKNEATPTTKPTM